MNNDFRKFYRSYGKQPMSVFDSVVDLSPTIVKTGHDNEPMIVTSTEAVLYENRSISFNVEVNEETADILMNQLMYLKYQDPTKDITLYINSPGGQVESGLALLDIMGNIQTGDNPLKIITICRGIAASMGSMILMCGAKGHRKAFENSHVMIHEVSGGSAGKTRDMEKAFAHQKELEERLFRIASIRTGQSIETITKDMKSGDVWMTAEDAKNYGIIDEIIHVDYGKF